MKPEKTEKKNNSTRATANKKAAEPVGKKETKKAEPKKEAKTKAVSIIRLFHWMFTGFITQFRPKIRKRT